MSRKDDLASFISAQNKSDETLPPCARRKLSKIENKNISLWFRVLRVSHKGMHAVNLRHKKANGLLQPSAWGCLFFFPLTQEVHQSLLSVISCKLPAVSAPPATVRVPQQKQQQQQIQLKLTSQQINRARFTTTVAAPCPGSSEILMWGSSRWDKSRDKGDAGGAELSRCMFVLSFLSLVPGGQTMRCDTNERGLAHVPSPEASKTCRNNRIWESLQVCLSAAQNSWKWRVIFTGAEPHECTIFEHLCQYGIVPQSQRKAVSSFRYTPLSCFTAFVVGRLLVFSGALNKNPFFSPGYRSKQPADVSSAGSPSTHFPPAPHLPDHLVAPFYSKLAPMVCAALIS